MTEVSTRQDVDLWIVNLAEIAQSAEQGGILSTAEQSRARRLAVASRRRQFEGGRYALRVILGKYLNVSPRSVPIRNGVNGRPFVNIPDTPLGFSMSHSGGIAVCAVAATKTIGIDIEFIRPMPDALDLARRFFHDSEANALAAMPSSILA